MKNSENSIVVGFKRPYGLFDFLFLQCDSQEENFTTTTSLCSSLNISQCTCENLYSASFYKYRMITAKNGMKNSTTSFYFSLQTRMLFLFFIFFITKLMVYNHYQELPKVQQIQILETTSLSIRYIWPIIENPLVSFKIECLTNKKLISSQILQQAVNSYTCFSTNKITVFRIVTQRYQFTDVYSDDVVFVRICIYMEFLFFIEVFPPLY